MTMGGSLRRSGSISSLSWHAQLPGTLISASKGVTGQQVVGVRGAVRRDWRGLSLIGLHVGLIIDLVGSSERRCDSRLIGFWERWNRD